MKSRNAKNNSFYDQKSLLFRFRKHLELKRFCKPKGHYLIACSGGADSTAVFHLLRLTVPTARFDLAHFNHGIRAKTAKRDELFVKKLAQEYGARFFVGNAKLGRKIPGQKKSLEENAREKRYEFLKKIYRQTHSDAVFLAHHLDDQAETVLMRMCQGTGPRGLASIRQEMKMGAMRVVRPLLPFSKSEILNFLRRRRFHFCEDETNRETDYLRNRIRKRVLPFLAREVNPRIIQALARIPEIASEENDLMARLEKAAAKSVIQKATSSRVTIQSARFRKLHPALQFRVLDVAAKKLDPAAGLLFEHAALIKSLLKKTDFSFFLPRGMEMVAARGRFWVQKPRR